MEDQQKIKRLSPIKAIRAKCLDCVCNDAREVRLCPSLDCPLWLYRFGCKPESNRVAKYFTKTE